MLEEPVFAGVLEIASAKVISFTICPYYAIKEKGMLFGTVGGDPLLDGVKQGPLKLTVCLPHVNSISEMNFKQIRHLTDNTLLFFSTHTKIMQVILKS